MPAAAQSLTPETKSYTMTHVAAGTFSVQHDASTWQWVIHETGECDDWAARINYSISIVSPVDGSTFIITHDSVYKSWSPEVAARRFDSMVAHALRYSQAVDRATVWVDAQMNAGALHGLGAAARRKRTKCFTAALVELSHGRIASMSSEHTFVAFVGDFAVWLSGVDFDSKTVSERVYWVGDLAACGSAGNLTRIGVIEKVTPKGVTIRVRETDARAKRLDAEAFAVWNRETVESIARADAIESMHI